MGSGDVKSVERLAVEHSGTAGGMNVRNAEACAILRHIKYPNVMRSIEEMTKTGVGNIKLFFIEGEGDSNVMSRVI